jgi:hypothetical protein
MIDLYCEECGATLSNSMSCWDMLGEIIAWEAQDPELLAEHFLTVASYNLQHPAQFAEGLVPQLQTSFISYLDGTLTLEQIRLQTRRAYNGAKRVLKPEAERRPVQRHWPMTIADVYLDAQPEGAAERVRAWANSIRQELI